MDRKSVIVLALSFALLALWFVLVGRLFPPQPLPPGAREAYATNQAPVPQASANLPERPVVPEITAAPAITLPRPEVPEKLVTIETDHARYVFTSHGGGLKRVDLKHYRETVGRLARRSPRSNEVASLNEGAPVPAFALIGSAALQGDGVYELTQTRAGVQAEKMLSDGVHVVKEFHVSTNYLMSVSVRLENRTNQAVRLPLQELVIGTATPMNPRDDARLLGVQWYNGARAQETGDPWFANRTLGCLPGTPRSTYVAGSNDVLWASTHNQFFALVTLAASNRPAPQIIARKIDLPPPTQEQLQADPQMVARPFGFQTAFLYPETMLPPGQSAQRQFDVFAGPKEYRTLERLASRFGNNVDLVMNFGFWGFFAKALLLSMNGLHALGVSYGLAIVVITIIIKLLFWPLTQISTRSMKRMQLLQPQIKELQAKYKDDPKKQQERMMAFWKEHKVNPAAGCLPIFIQIPVFFGFYTMLQSAIELRGESFLWVLDLSQPDTVWVIPGLGFPLNPLPLIMGATQFWQMRLTPPSPGVDPVQQKIFQYMPLIFLFILYNFSSGLTLYWTVQNLLSIAQMKLTRATDAAAKASGPAPKAAPAVARKRK